MIEIIKGDLLTSDAQYIAHQTNCVSNTCSGIAKIIFDKYPYANTYLNRKQKSIPGTIDVFNDHRGVINMNAQYYPGYYNNSYANDDEKIRKQYFHQALIKIAKLKPKSIAFPFNIGCGLAGGNWNHYEQMLNNFEKYTSENFGTHTYLFRLE